MITAVHTPGPVANASAESFENLRMDLAACEKAYSVKNHMEVN